MRAATHPTGRRWKEPGTRFTTISSSPGKRCPKRPEPKPMANKVYASPQAALADVLFDGMTIMSGGFGLSGNPEKLIPAIQASGVRNLTIISNNCGADGFGLWALLNNGQIKKMIS